MSKLIIAGGRNFFDINLARESLIQLVEQGWIDDSPTIISGGAKGADYIGEELAIEFDLELHIYKPDWKDMTEPCVIKYNQYGAYNALAGMNRNHTMGDEATHLLAFWDGKSSGTKDMIEYMHSLNKPVQVIKY